MPEWKYSVNGVFENLHYLDDFPQNSRPVILLHGLGVDSSSWYFQQDALGKAGFRPIVVDLPGFGRSSHHGKRWRFDQIVCVLVEFTHHISEKPVSLVGISLGGALCLGMLALAQERFGNAVLINSFSKIRPEKFSHFLYLFTRFYKVSLLPMREQAEYMAMRLFPTGNDAQFRKMIIDQIMATDRRIYRQTILALGTLNLDQNIPNINTECLLITGAEDSTIPPALQESLAGRLKNSHQMIIAGAGHAVIVQKPEQVNRAVIQFLNRTSHNH